jgi:transglutaminase-like putative cysteine protease
MPLRDKLWDKRLQLMLIGGFALNLVPHLAIVPTWVAVSALTCIVWKLLYLTRGLQLPKNWLTSVASVLSALGVFATYHTVIGQEAAGALLVVATGLKLLETNRYRDAMLVVFTCYFLLMTYLLDTQSLAATIFMAVDAALITILMAQIHRHERKTPTTITPSLRMLALSLPVWTLLFFIFPRFSNSLGYLKPGQASSGFSEDLDPGSIGKLVDNEEVAYRVTFDDTGEHRVGLSPDALYWRGAILTQSDGLKWTRSAQVLKVDAYDHPKSVGFVRTTVWLEPEYQRWLFALDTPVDLTSGEEGLLHMVRRQPGFIYEFSGASQSRVSYSVRSILSPPRQLLSPQDRLSYTQLPPNLDAQVIELAKKALSEVVVVQEKSPAAALSQHFMEWFTKNGFRYTKSPGTLQGTTGVAQLSEFLFTRKVGFCEHYSAAFATLMRAAGVPSRVVVGFQGATHNNVGNYWLVRKMDAHAWTEIWMDEDNGRGRWLRVDPTEAVAPMRLQLGGRYNSLDENSIAGLSRDELRYRLDRNLGGALHNLLLAFDAVQMKWNAFLLSYDLEYQLQILARLGLNDSNLLILGGLTLLSLMLLGALFVWLNRRREDETSPLVREWRHFCATIGKAGVERHLDEGPLAFSTRAAALLPTCANDIETVATLYATLRYGPTITSSRIPRSDFRAFRKLVRRFSVAPLERH